MGSALATAACASHPAGRGVGQVREGLGAAISAPLYDLNLRRKSLADVLTWAQVRPYDMSGLERCDAIAEEVALLDEALGPDLDEPAAPEASSLSARASDAAADAALDAIRDTATDLIPGRSWIRRLSGASRREREAERAHQAGQAQRAFLKGVGMQRNCAPPAAPRWFTPATPPPPRIIIQQP